MQKYLILYIDPHGYTRYTRYMRYTRLPAAQPV